VTLALDALVPDAANVPGLSALLRRTVTIDLFDPPQRERIRTEAVRLNDGTRTQNQIAALIAEKPTGTAVGDAIRLQRAMNEQGLTSPYVILEEPPANAPLRRHKTPSTFSRRSPAISGRRCKRGESEFVFHTAPGKCRGLFMRIGHRKDRTCPAGSTSAGGAGETLGISLVVGLAVDQIVSWVWDCWSNPKGSLAANMNAKLDECTGRSSTGTAQGLACGPRWKMWPGNGLCCDGSASTE
jgi:hypothetical protein